jgi:microcystin-dependent protein
MSYRINNVSVVPPVGSVVSYTGATAPNGWLLCNGNAYSRTTYSALYNVIGTTYNTATTSASDFNVPNFQAAFLRGAGTQKFPKDTGTTYGYTSPNNARTINTPQGTSTLTHNHAVNIATHTHTLTGSTHGHTVNDEKHNHKLPNVYYYSNTVPRPLEEYTGLGGYASVPTFTYNVANAGAGTVGSSNIGTATSTSSNNANLTNTLGDNTNNKNTNETFPFNYAINWIIKY